MDNQRFTLKNGNLCRIGKYNIKWMYKT